MASESGAAGATSGTGDIYVDATRSELTRAEVRPAISGKVALLFSLTCGLAVANVYYAQPLLGAMADEFGIGYATIGLVFTVAQIGYGTGLLLLVPLGDLIDRRRLIVVQSLLSAIALLVVAFAPTSTILLAGMAAIGFLAVVTQVVVAYAALIAGPSEKGRIVGIITSGIVTGIMLARAVSGTLSDIFGWRSVYLVSAAVTLIIAGLLFKALPRQQFPNTHMSYPRLIGSVFTLFIEEPVLRVRAAIGLMIFSANAALWTPMVLPLSAPPFSLSRTQVGLFGLAGAIGAIGAAHAGKLADRGHAQRTTGTGLAIMLISWLPISLLTHSLWGLIVGVLMIAYGLQLVHVSNLSQIYGLRPDARSRLTAGYMVCYAIGSAAGAIVSTLVYAKAGWIGVCLIGGAISTVALAFWALTRHSTREVPA